MLDQTSGFAVCGHGRTMKQLVECVPNFSEGRSHQTVQALVDAVASVTGVLVLDHSLDRDHHRSVMTFVGEPDAMVEAAFRAVRAATDLIDLRKHEGVHPRIGATDVVPFVPIKGTTMQDCIRMAKRLGQRVGRDLGIPVFLYERAATHPDHAAFGSIRRGGRLVAREERAFRYARGGFYALLRPRT